ncbi:MAG: hypothetical protein QM601_05845 [Pseudoxanthomonas sp.]
MNDPHPHRFPLLRAVVLAAALALLGACVGRLPLTPAQDALVQAARANGASDVRAVAREDGGLQLGGELAGKQFALVFPEDWNRQAALFAHGYSAPGSPVAVAADPMAAGNDPQGAFRTPYSQGFAVGHSAYDKAGMDVRGAVENSHRLAQLLARLGSTRTYLIGASMGGNIVVALLDKHPQDFAGAIAGCGVVGDWPAEIGWLDDVRAVYDYFTRGTGYELPGRKSLARSALASPSFGPLRMWNMKRVAGPIYALFEAAQAHPGGAESRIIDNVAAVAGTPRDPAAFVLPIMTVALGMDDLNATFGGAVAGNVGKVYHSPYLDQAGNARLNAGIERVAADPAAVARAAQWYKASGRIGVPLLSIYNTTDSLVPSALHEDMLRAAVAAAGNEQWLLQRPLPPMKVPLPASKLQGLAHCGFTDAQIAGAWNDLRRWVETGQRPPAMPAPSAR